MTAVKTCVTCAFKSGDKCTRQWMDKPEDQVDRVTGHVTRQSGQFYSCDTQRRYTINSCGPRGVWWTNKEAYKPKKESKNGNNIFKRIALSVLGLFD